MIEPPDDGGVDSERRSPSNVGDRTLSKTRLMSRECGTCIFAPGNRMNLPPGRLKQLVEQARTAGSYIVCHSTLPESGYGLAPAICRGFADRYDTQALQVIGRLWGFVEAEPPDPGGQPPDRASSIVTR